MIIILGLFSFFGLAMNLTFKPTPIKIEYPSSWPKPVYNFDNNPLTQEGIDLGRKLFYDPILSIDGSISCSNCHLSYTAFTHVDHPLSHGVNDSFNLNKGTVIYFQTFRQFSSAGDHAQHLLHRPHFLHLLQLVAKIFQGKRVTLEFFL